MTRGNYDSVIKNEIYSGSLKKWNVSLNQVDMIWYDMVANEHEVFPFKDLIVKRLKELRQQVNNGLEKRFVYFIASRKKVRFSESKKPKHSLFTDKIHLYLEVGKERMLRKVTFTPRDIETGAPIQLKVQTTEKYITFTDISGVKATYSIHDFLLQSGIDLGLETTVQYVGKTEMPESRPIIKPHNGLKDILYNISNEDNDIFVFYNLFKVMAYATNEKHKMDFIVPNSMTDEIKVNKEGDILEKCFILYFLSKNQRKNIRIEEGELKNNLVKIANENKITNINVEYEVDDESEYYKFGSTEVEPKVKHSFSFSIKENELSRN